jgi:hypothetical protein
LQHSVRAPVASVKLTAAHCGLVWHCVASSSEQARGSGRHWQVRHPLGPAAKPYAQAAAQSTGGHNTPPELPPELLVIPDEEEDEEAPPVELLVEDAGVPPPVGPQADKNATIPRAVQRTARKHQDSMGMPLGESSAPCVVHGPSHSPPSPAHDQAPCHARGGAFSSGTSRVKRPFPTESLTFLRGNRGFVPVRRVISRWHAIRHGGGAAA